MEFANVFEAEIERFDEDLDKVKSSKFTLRLIDAENEEKRGIDPGC